MFIRAPEAHSRSLIKAVSWRILGSIDTFIISYLVTGHVVAAASIASVESVTKILLFYGHERAWMAVRWGKGQVVEVAEEAETSDAPAPKPALA